MGSPATIDTPPARLRDRFHRYWLSTAMQTVLDIVILVTAVVTSYLLRYDFAIPRKEWHFVLAQVPFMALLQLLALTIAGGRDFIWRYTDMAHIKAFVYAGLGSLFPILVL